MRFLDALRSRRVLVADSDIRSQLAGIDAVRCKCPEAVNVLVPELIMNIHRTEINSGASIITCNSMGCSRYNLSKYSLEGCQEEIIKSSIFNAAKASQGNAYIAYSLGPTGRPGMDFNWYYNQFREQVAILNRFPVDVVFIEGFACLQEARAALLAVKETCIVPVVCAMTFGDAETLPHAAAVVLGSLGADAVGIYGNTPEEIHNWISEMYRVSSKPLVIRPGIGGITPEVFAEKCERLLAFGAVVLGGGPGTGPIHTRFLDTKVSNRPAVRMEMNSLIAASGKKVVEIGSGKKLVIIGERINPTGKPDMAEELERSVFDRVVHEAADQQREGADMLDVNVFTPGLDEEQVLPSAIRELSNTVSLPLSIDTRNPGALAKALRIYPGRALVNSIDLCPATLGGMLPVIKKYGAAVIALTMGESGVPASAAMRLDMACKLVELIEQEGIDRTDVLMDCLALPLSSGGSACTTTLDALSLIKDRLGAPTVLGISNVSYGMTGRSEINSVFLAMAVSRGLNSAIVNTGQDSIRKTIRAINLMDNPENSVPGIFKIKGSDINDQA
ncbi:MAG: 5-methyltetrahydrofolate--homocysteine methyltransferase [Firmicutes bacterium]|nr:5-methyltetrahydrofolate--homocysteine methyltransferase [Bacillota bacterium]MDI6705343.1 dihydropteroate synthase [Bacillota bacterium]